MQGHAGFALFDAARNLRLAQKVAAVRIEVFVELSAFVFGHALFEHRKRLPPEIGHAEAVAERFRHLGDKPVLQKRAERFLKGEILHIGIEDRRAVELRARGDCARAVCNIEQDQFVFGFTVCKVWHFIPP